MPEVEGVKNVLLDIEGTICPISFVKDTLFPYALNALPDVLATKWDDESFKAYRDAFPKKYRSSPASLQAHVEDLTKRDVKVAYLKNLQGYLWEDGYKSGAYSTPLFPDVAPQLKAWKDDGLGLAIYSSGSVFAQRLLFQHVSIGSDAATAGRKRSATAVSSTENGGAEPAKKAPRRSSRNKPAAEEATLAEEVKPASEDTADDQPAGTEDLGDLMTKDGWFDTTNAGLKSEAASYEKIVQALSWKPDQTLFLTDNVKEYDAADSAGLKVLLLDRPGNAAVSAEDKARMQIVSSLDEIELIASKPTVGGAAATEEQNGAAADEKEKS